MIRIALAFAVLLVLSAHAVAVPCDVVRQYAKVYTMSQMVRWAKANGYSDAQISAARKCLR